MSENVKSSSEINSELISAKNEISQLKILLQNEINQRKEAEFLLGERKKELQCQNRISKILAATNLSVHEAIEQILSTIQPAMQFPEITEASISINDIILKTPNFTDSKYFLSQPVTVGEQTVGEVVVNYHEDKIDEKNKDVFLPEERDLLFSIAARISGFLAQKNEEKKATENERIYKSFLDSSPDVVTIADLQGNILFSSLSDRMFGYPKGTNFSGMNIMQFIHKKDHQRAMQNISLMLKNLFIESEEYTAVRYDGTTFPVEVNGEFILDENGQPEKLVFVTRDISKRKKIEKKLNETREKYRNLVETINDVLYEISIDGTITYISPSVVKIFGYEADELIGKNQFEFMHPDDIPMVIEAFKIAETVIFPFIEIRYIVKDGSVKWVRSTFNPKYDDGKLIGGSGLLIDITEQKQIEIELRKTDAQYREAEKLAKLGHWEMDLIANTATWSDEVYRIFGLDSKNFKVSFDSFIQRVHPGDMEMVKNAYLESLSSKKPQDIIHRILLDNGETRIVNERYFTQYDEHGIAISSRGTVMDISEQYFAEKELRMFKKAADAASYGIAINKLDGELIYVNEAWAKMHGYEIEELIGNNLSIGHNENQIKEVFEAIDELLATGKMVSKELWHTRKDGTEFPTLMNSTIITDKENHPQFMSATAIDITELKNAQNKLAESEFKYRSIFENIQDTYYEATIDGILLELSPSFEILTKGQYKREDLIGKQLIDFYVNPVERELFYAGLLKNGKVSDFELTLQNKDKSHIPVAVTSTLVLGENGTPVKIFGNIRDISERKRSEEQLKLSEEKYRSLIESSDAAILMIAPDGRIRYMNAHAAAFHNKMSDEMTGVMIQDILTSKDIEMLMEDVAKILEVKKGFTREIEIGADEKHIHLRSSIQPVKDADGNIISVLFYSNDITESVHAREELLKSEEKFRFLVESIHDVIYEFAADGTLIYVSPSLERISGYSSDEVTGQNFFGFIHPDDRQRVAGRMGSLPQESLNISEFRLLDKENNVHWVRATSNSVFENGVLKGGNGTITDITAQKIAEEELRIFKIATDAASNGIALSKPDGELIYVNNAYAKMHGYEEKELIGKNLVVCHSDGQLNTVNRLLDKLFAEGSFISEEVGHLRKDGSEFPTLMNATVIKDNDNKPKYISGTTIDITNLKNAQYKLSESEFKYRSIFENIQDTYYETSLDGILLEISPSVYNLSGGLFSREELIGNPVFHLYKNISDRDRLIDQIYKYGKITDFELELKNRDDRFKHVSVSATLILDENNKPVKIGGSIRDISERKLAEEKIRQNEIKYRSIFENIQDIYYENTLDGTLIEISPSVSVVSKGQFTREMLIGTPVSDMYANPDVKDKLSAELFKNGRITDYEVELLNRDLSTIPVSISASLIFDENNQAIKVAGSIRDISERKNAEEKIKQSEFKYRTIFENIQDTYYETSVDGIVIEVSPSISVLSKGLYNREELIGQSVYNLYADPGIRDKLVKRISKTGKVPDFELALKNKDLTVTPVSVSATMIFDENKKPVKISGSIRDISERKSAEQKLNDQKDKLQAVITAVPDLMFIIDKNGKYLEYFASNKNILGIPLDHIVGKRINDLFGAEQADLHLMNIDKCLQTNEIIEYDYSMQLDDTNRYFELRIVPMPNNTVLTFIRDFTERKTIEQEILSLNQNLELKVEERTRELAEKSHELENFFNVSLDLLCIADLGGNFIKVNKAWTDILGYTVEELKNHKFPDFVHIDDMRATLAAIETLKNNNTVLKFINRYRTKSGDYRFIEWHSVPVGETFYTAARDVTENKFTTDFQYELLQLSSKLTGIPLAEIKPSLNIALQQIGTFLQADRAYIFEFTPDLAIMNNTFEWNGAGIEPEIENWKSIETNLFPNWMKDFRNKKNVVIPSVDNLPEEWLNERQDVLNQALKSFILIPLFIEDELIGFTGLDYLHRSKDFSETEIGILKLWSTNLSGLINNYRVEVLLEETRLNFQTFFNTIDDFLFVIDENGNIIHTNETVKRRLGYSDDELTGQPVLNIHPAERREEAGRIIMEMLQGTTENCPVPVIDRWGKEIEVETQVKKGTWNGKPAIFGVTKDISQIKLSEQKFSSAFHTNSAVMSITRFSNSQFVDVNNAFLSTLGYARNEIMGETLMSLGIIRVENAEIGIQTAINSGIPVRDFEVEVYSKSGEMHIFLLSAEEIFIGTERCILSVATDITSRKRAEEQLQWNKSLLEMMSNSSPLGFLVVDNRTDEILYFNKRFCQIWGIEQIEEQMLRGEMKNNDIIPYCLPVLTDINAFAESCKPLQDENNRTVVSDEIQFTNNRVIHRYSTQIRGLDDLYYGRFYIFEDVTEEKRVQQELQNARIEAERANSAKSEFLSRMSHELRTPMNSILGFAQLLQMGVLNEKQERGVNHILKSGKYLLNLINEVLELSRIELGRLSLSMESVAVNALVSETIDFARPQSEQKSIILVNKSLSHEVIIFADKQKLKQILLNLLINAIKYSDENTKVEIMTEIIRQQAVSEERIRISVVDSGPGISEENIKKLFSPFERLGAEKTKIEGTGLGLAVSKKLAEAMNGKIGVDSSFEKGSIFWVEFPLIQKMKIKTNKSDIVTETALFRTDLKGSVLYVEDNESNIELVEQVLTENRPSVKLYFETVGSNAINKALSVLPDLILLDLNLPEMHGSEILEEIMNNTLLKNIPVVIVSADAMPGQIKSLLKAGAQNYLTKPINIAQLLNVTDQYLSKL